jgi:hypothetical protein
MCRVLHTVENSQKELDSLTVGYDFLLVRIALKKEREKFRIYALLMSLILLFAAIYRCENSKNKNIIWFFFFFVFFFIDMLI